MTRRIKLAPAANLGRLVDKWSGQVVGVDIGPNGAMYIVIASKTPDNRIQHVHGGSSPKPVSDVLQDYRVIAVADGAVAMNVHIRGERMNFPTAQPLLDKVILIGARCAFRSPKDIDENGRVYSKAGKLLSTFVLGDGINHAQTTASGGIWTSYGDEGVYGNLGWEKPLGKSGLVAWDSSGKKLYEYKPPEGVGPINDCYSMNVASDRDVWVCYDSDFPLVHIRDMKVQGVWDMKKLDDSTKLCGAHFAVQDEHVLFWGGYGAKSMFHLYRLGRNGKSRRVGSVRLSNRLGKTIPIGQVLGRGDTMHVLGGKGSLYQLRVEQVIERLSRR